MMNTGLYRSDKSAIIGGVCAGLGDFLGISPVLVRGYFLLLAFGNGMGILLYILLWLIMPLNLQLRRVTHSNGSTNGGQMSAHSDIEHVNNVSSYLETPPGRLVLLLGVILIVIGLLSIPPVLHLNWSTWFKFEIIWPILLIVGGLALLVRRPKGAQLNDRTT